MKSDIGKMLVSLVLLLVVMFYVKINLGNRKLFETPGAIQPTPTQIPTPTPELSPTPTVSPSPSPTGNL